jgi:hypothetical protein
VSRGALWTARGLNALGAFRGLTRRLRLASNRRYRNPLRGPAHHLEPEGEEIGAAVASSSRTDSATCGDDL